ncbi:unnamed protein product [Lampetra fluviatilis]
MRTLPRRSPLPPHTKTHDVIATADQWEASMCSRGAGRGKGVGGVDDGDACDDEEEEGRRGLEMARHDGRALRKLPVHVGLVLSEAAGAERGVRDVANAVLWCVALGVSYVSVFDARGESRAAS